MTKKNVSIIKFLDLIFESLFVSFVNSENDLFIHRIHLAEIHLPPAYCSEFGPYLFGNCNGFLSSRQGERKYYFLSTAEYRI